MIVYVAVCRCLKIEATAEMLNENCGQFYTVRIKLRSRTQYQFATTRHLKYQSGHLRCCFFLSKPFQVSELQLPLHHTALSVSLNSCWIHISGTAIFSMQLKTYNRIQTSLYCTNWILNLKITDNFSTPLHRFLIVFKFSQVGLQDNKWLTQ